MHAYGKIKCMDTSVTDKSEYWIVYYNYMCYKAIEDYKFNFAGRLKFLFSEDFKSRSSVCVLNVNTNV